MSPARVLALVFPLLVLLIAIAWMGAPKAWEPSKEVKEVEFTLEKAQPDIISIGNSKAAADINAEILSTLTTPPAKIARLKVDGSPAPTWYTLLKYRVYANNYRPKLVLVVAMLKPMLQTKIGSEHGAEAGLARMTQHFAEPDEVIATKTLGHSGSGLRLRLTEKKAELRAGLLDGLRDYSGELFFGEPPAEALSKVFAQEAVDNHARGGRVIPVVEAQYLAKKESLDPKSSYLADLVALAKEHQTRLVFVRSPLAPSFSSLDAIDPSTEQAAIELINELGAGYLDMRDMNFPEASFKDGYHLNPQASEAFTTELVARLHKIGALSEAPMARARIPTAPSKVERTGTPPQITPKGKGTSHPPCGEELKIPEWRFLSEDSMIQAGFGPISPLVALYDQKPMPRRSKAPQLSECSGAFAHVKDVIRYSRMDPEDKTEVGVGFNPEPYVEIEGFPRVWWAYPGTALSFYFDRPWSEDSGNFTMELRLSSFGKGKALPEVLVAGKPVALVEEEGIFIARFSGDAPAASWSLQINVPEEGPFLAIKKLAFGEGDRQDVLVGGEPPFTIRLLEYAPKELPAPPVIGAAGAITEKGGIYRMALPWAAPFASDRLSKELKMRGCSPLRMLEDGVPLPSPNAGFKAVKEEGGGKYLHQGSEFLFSTPDNSDPRSNGRSYTVGLDASRDCRRQRWLYPGDTLLFAPPGSQTARLRGPVRSLAIQATTTGDPTDPTPITLVLKDKNQEYLRVEIPLSQLFTGTVAWDLETPIPLRAPDISVSLKLPEGAPLVLVTLLTISEGSAAEIRGE